MKEQSFGVIVELLNEKIELFTEIKERIDTSNKEKEELSESITILEKAITDLCSLYYNN